MAHRITEADLQRRVDYLNRITDSPAQYIDDFATCKPAIGHWHLSHAYGGVALHRTMNSGGGVTSYLTAGHVPKRELFNALCAFLEGIEYVDREIQTGRGWPNRSE